MLPIAQQFRILSLKPSSLSSSQVRWRARKPISLGTAKSKLFRVPKRPEMPKEEDDELTRLFNSYRTVRNSLAKYLTEKHSILLMEKADGELLQKAFQEDFAKCSAINDEWNKNLAAIRDERTAKEIQEQVDKAKERVERVKAIRVQQLQEAEERVRREKEAAATFITMEQLDEVIDKAIENPVDYNYAIDPEGNRYEGRDANPEDVQIRRAN